MITNAAQNEDSYVLSQIKGLVKSPLLLSVAISRILAVVVVYILFSWLINLAPYIMIPGALSLVGLFCMYISAYNKKQVGFKLRGAYIVRITHWIKLIIAAVLFVAVVYFAIPAIIKFFEISSSLEAAYFQDAMEYTTVEEAFYGVRDKLVNGAFLHSLL